jgi:cell division protein FtsB
VTVLFLCTLLTVSGLLIFGQRGITHLVTLQEQFEELESENHRIEQENIRLKQEIKLLKENQAYIEDMARKQLGLVKEDELVYQFQPQHGGNSE